MYGSPCGGIVGEKALLVPSKNGSDKINCAGTKRKKEATEPAFFESCCVCR
jgi:hypothetical protein